MPAARGSFALRTRASKSGVRSSLLGVIRAGMQPEKIFDVIGFSILCWLGGNRFERQDISCILFVDINISTTRLLFSKRNAAAAPPFDHVLDQIGRASCRERGGR